MGSGHGPPEPPFVLALFPRFADMILRMVEGVGRSGTEICRPHGLLAPETPFPPPLVGGHPVASRGLG